MKKTLLLLGAGIAIGYSWGFKDARQHDEDIVTRLVARVRRQGEGYGNDVDGAMDRLERK